MSGNQPTPAPAATPAERLRSLLLVTTSLSLSTTDHRAHLVGRHRVIDGRLVVELPARSCLAQHLLRAGDAVAIVEVTDLAPVAVRDRVRARATLTGWLTPIDAGPEPELFASFDLAAGEVVTAGVVTPVGPEDFAVARPDPLATSEAELLCHLDDHHPETVRTLARLVPLGPARPVRPVRPVALDRFGLTLRLEFPDRDRDVRLPFRNPLRHPDEAAGAIRELLNGSANPGHSCPGGATVAGTVMETGNPDRPGPA